MKKINKNLITFPAILFLIFGVFSVLPNNASAQLYTVTTQTGATYDLTPYEAPAIKPIIHNNPTPIIDSISPTSAYQCSGTRIINIYGENFISTSVAKWNGSSRVTTFISSNHLAMQATTSDICGLGNYLITVYNNRPSGGLSNGAYFTVKTAQVITPVNPTPPVPTPKPAPAPKPTTVAPVKTNTVSCIPDNTSNSKNDLTANALFGSNGFMPTNLFQWLLLFIMVLLIVILTRKILNKNKKEKPLNQA